jgi:AsmA protein
MRRLVVAACGIVVLLLVAAPAALYLVLDTNDLKARAAQYVKAETGRDLKMTGPVTLSFFPWLGAELSGVELAPPAGFGAAPFAAIDEVGVKVKVMPLISGDVVVDRVMIKGVRLRLESRKDGRTTWDGLGGASTTSASPASGGESSSSIKSVRVGGVSVSGADVTWSDEAADSYYSLKNLELTTGAFGGSEPTDLSLAFDLGHGSRGERGSPSPTRVTLNGRMLLDAQQLHAELADVTLKMRESTLTGRVAASATQKPALRFDLTIDALDLDQYLPGSGTPASASPAATAPASEDPFAGLRSLEAEGSFRVGRLRAAGVRFGDIAAKMAASGGVATVGPTTASFYGGRYTGTVAIDARGKAAVLKLDQRLAGVDVGALVKDLQLYDSFSGTGDVMLRVTARGADQPSITKTLNGQASIALRDGKIEGADFLKMITQARQAVDRLRGKEPAPAQARPSDQTAFTKLSASATITSGVARNSDLVLESPSLHATGSGTVDLGRETIDYVLRASSAQAGNVLIPIAITGPFAAPSYRVQAGAMAREAAKKELKKEIGKRLGGLFKKKP